MDKEIIVYLRHTRASDGTQFLVPIGEGVRRPNGDLEVELWAYPTNGQLVIREKKP